MSVSSDPDDADLLRDPDRDPNEDEFDEEEQDEREELRKLRLISMTATPATLTPFQEAVIQWRIQVPSSVNPDLRIDFMLDNEIVPEDGSRTVSPRFSHRYILKAKTTFAERELGRQTITVDSGGCDVYESVVPVNVGPMLADRLSGSSQISIRDGGIAVTFGNFSMTIAVPLEIEIPNWFNANMDVNMRFSISAGPRQNSRFGNVNCVLRDVSVDVSWRLLSHIFTLGCTGAIQAALEIQAKAFLEMLGGQLSSQLAETVEDEHDRRIDFLTDNDPQGRDYRFHSLQVDSAGIRFVSCPD